MGGDAQPSEGDARSVVRGLLSSGRELLSFGFAETSDPVASGWALAKKMKGRIAKGERTQVLDLCGGNIDTIQAPSTTGKTYRLATAGDRASIFSQ